ncbi:SDR family oxidoreductase [Galbitalea soli]|uniref:SDR family oxidoreductase n=1 Tax=Galbitalea soli TaxID=1268042 RepID=A0A7C9PNL2_9MICO|nr:SDR family oxidoreductase [Galbitalea soli]NEM91511.1 SDR family oxidoreductase [Galbitalea soli]NYJ30204.1 uncharacterized protein YbjT (DUF2867 family) [Galbitalea soli]
MTQTPADTIALTGTTGALGGAVLAQLPGRHVLIGRDARALAPGHEHRAAGYGDEAAMTATLDGVGTLFFVSGRESATRLEEHRTVVRAAATAGVRRIVYISFLGATATSTFTLGRQHFFTERAIRDTGLAFTFLRDSLYQDFLPFMAGDDGVIRGPAGDGVLGAVARADIAEVAATVLRAARGAEPGASPHDGASYDLTGPEAISMATVAELLTTASGRPVGYVDETEEEAYASRARFGAPAFEVEGWVTSYQAIANGELAEVSPDVQRLLGRPPTSFAHFLRTHPESYAHLQPRV